VEKGRHYSSPPVQTLIEALDNRAGYSIMPSRRGERAGRRWVVMGFVYVKEIIELLPILDMKGHMSADHPEIGCVTGDERGADAPGRQGDQHVQDELADFLGVIMLPFPDQSQHVCGVEPLAFGGRKDLTPMLQIPHEAVLQAGCGSPEQFVQHDR
jgi:hypothetical protein